MPVAGAAAAPSACARLSLVSIRRPASPCCRRLLAGGQRALLAAACVVMQHVRYCERHHALYEIVGHSCGLCADEACGLVARLVDRDDDEPLLGMLEGTGEGAAGPAEVAVSLARFQPLPELLKALPRNPDDTSRLAAWAVPAWEAALDAHGDALLTQTTANSLFGNREDAPSLFGGMGDPALAVLARSFVSAARAGRDGQKELGSLELGSLIAKWAVTRRSDQAAFVVQRAVSDDVAGTSAAAPSFHCAHVCVRAYMHVSWRHCGR